MVGETLSHFKLVEKLGQGSMGVVYRAVDLNLDRPVAIKILTPEAQRDEDSVGRFLREAKTASKLQHPAITTIYEFGVKDDLRYLVMEYVEGQTLREMLKKGPLPPRQAVEIAIQVADALTLADENGIIHRDIKSENIMVTERGQVKVLDFGLAKMISKGEPAPSDMFHTAVGLVVGTVTHMSPEQALGAELDVRTDIYATGVVLFEMVTGALPFSGASPNVVLAKILNQPPPAASDYNPDIPPALEKLIAKCLEKNRSQRCQNALRLLADLRAIKQQTEGAREWIRTGVMQPGEDFAPAPAPPGELGDLAPQTGAAAPPALPPSPEGAEAAPTATLPAPPGVGAAAAPEAATVAIARVIPAGAPERAPLSPAARAWRQHACFLLSAVRVVFSAATTLYALGCALLFMLPLLQRERTAEMLVFQLLHQVIDPVLVLAVEVVGFDFTFQRMNFLLPGLAAGTYILKHAVTGRLEQLESEIREPLLARPAVVALVPDGERGLPFRVAGPRKPSRMSLLRDYAVAKRILGEVKKEMAFLSVDVAGSAELKLGAEKGAVEQAFSEYRKFLERTLREFRVYKMAWTPDGLMSCFPSIDDAAGAARKLLAELDQFNREAHQLPNKFQLRCGLNFGEVLLPETKPLEEVSDEVIDVAGHLQKRAEANSLWVTAETYRQLKNRSGFTRVETQVDRHGGYILRK